MLHECRVDDALVHSCRTMLGARANGYPGVPDNFDAQHLHHARRIGRPIDLAHAFAAPGQVPFGDRHVVNWTRNHTEAYLVHNWKPVARWADAGTQAARNRIRVAARRVKHLRYRKIHLVIHHEPENDTAVAAARKGAGTPDEYRRMWRIVREIFDEEGCENALFGMAYMNYPKWDSIIADLWPGDDLVDWVWCNLYGSARRPDPEENFFHFTTLRARHRLGLGKPLGIIEWGIHSAGRDGALDYFDAATAFLDKPAADMVKAWMVFDSPGAHDEGGLRLAFDDHGRPHPEKLAAYRRFAHHQRFRCPVQ
jgi:hypothetical protein